MVARNQPEHGDQLSFESAGPDDDDEPLGESGKADDSEEPWVESYQLDEQKQSGVRTTIAAILLVLAQASAVISGLAVSVVETYMLIKLGVAGEWNAFFGFLFVGSFALMTVAYVATMALAGVLLLVARVFDPDAFDE